MQEKKLLEGENKQTYQNPLEKTTIDHIKGRSFVVQAVFKRENTNTLGAILISSILTVETTKATGGPAPLTIMSVWIFWNRWRLVRSSG